MVKKEEEFTKDFLWARAKLPGNFSYYTIVHKHCHTVTVKINVFGTFLEIFDPKFDVILPDDLNSGFAYSCFEKDARVG